MTDTKQLMDIIEENKVSITWLAEKVGCSRNRIYAILHGTGGECTVVEIMRLTEALHLTSEKRDSIFFNEKRD